MQIVNAEHMRALDRAAIEDCGIPGIDLMERAGRGTADYILSTYPEAASGKVTIMCGRGNNGGDGFVIARCLQQAGANVCAVLVSASDRVQGDARANLEAFRSLGGRIVEITSEQDLGRIGSDLSHACLIVDALLGTGLASDVTGLYARAMNAVSEASHAPVVAVDIPSGIDASTGRVMGCALRAHSTCTFGLPKYGHLLYPGAGYTGKLTVIDIGIPQQLIAQAKLPGSVQDMSDFAAALPERSPGAHKGDCGHVLLLAGSVGKTGAAVLCARAAMRCGAGLVTAAAPEKAQGHIAAQLLEAMSVPLDDCNGALAPEALQQILSLCADKTVLAVGPGLGSTHAVAETVRGLIPHVALPMVIDADGLNALARDPRMIKQASGPVILTPHPGEMARLTGQSTAQVQSDRIGSACSLAADLGAIVVLKGARTVIAAPDGRHWINMTGNAAMASGGMGDVLTGMISALLAQRLPALSAARLAVCLHGRIGDMIVAERGRAPVLASDIIERIPSGLRECMA
ncbi:MAG: NAD(P)H-hydrate dehydratase [Deltaproteobacteria bacterium]|nr:NAD(P)H-hydrate dehydratase [Deltaproteobacteria bacterium]